MPITLQHGRAHISISTQHAAKHSCARLCLSGMQDPYLFGMPLDFLPPPPPTKAMSSEGQQAQYRGAPYLRASERLGMQRLDRSPGLETLQQCSDHLTHHHDLRPLYYCSIGAVQWIHK